MNFKKNAFLMLAVILIPLTFSQTLSQNLPTDEAKRIPIQSHVPNLEQVITDLDHAVLLKIGECLWDAKDPDTLSKNEYYVMRSSMGTIPSPLDPSKVLEVYLGYEISTYNSDKPGVFHSEALLKFFTKLNDHTFYNLTSGMVYDFKQKRAFGFNRERLEIATDEDTSFFGKCSFSDWPQNSH